MKNEQDLVGTIPLGKNRELHFLVTSFRGKLITHIREYLKTPGYTGYTRRGIVFNTNTLESIINMLNGLPSTQNINYEQEIGKISKNSITDIVVRLIKQKEIYYLDIREHIRSDNYEGWTKKGVRIPLKAYDEIKAFIHSCHDAIRGKLNKHVQRDPIIMVGSTDSSLEELLGDKLLNFPGDFIEAAAQHELTEICLPKEPLKLGIFRKGVQYVVDDADFVLKLRNEVEAKYVIYAQLRGATSVNIPQKMFAIFRAVKKYEKYAREIKKKLIDLYKAQNHSYIVAKNKARLNFQKAGIPWLE